jgi:putative flavoprotein involved in K+ transport
MADYLEAYAERFDLPVRTRARVDRLSRDGDGYIIEAGPLRLSADNVVIATGANQTPRRPAFADELDPGVVQMHSYEYRRPSQLRDGAVLVVGLGNSGAEIAFELVRSHETWLSGEPTGEIPFRHGPAAARFAFPVIRFMGHHVLTQGTPIGRKLGPKLEAGAPPLIRVKTKDLVAAGVQRVPRTAGIKDGMPLLDDGRIVDVQNIIWCTGFRYDFGWIDLPVVDADGAPLHRRGVARGQPGLYFMGLVFQYAVSSDVLPGMSRDAEFIAKDIVEQRRGMGDG